MSAWCDRVTNGWKRGCQDQIEERRAREGGRKDKELSEKKKIKNWVKKKVSGGRRRKEKNAFSRPCTGEAST